MHSLFFFLLFFCSVVLALRIWRPDHLSYIVYSRRFLTCLQSFSFEPQLGDTGERPCKEEGTLKWITHTSFLKLKLQPMQPGFLLDELFESFPDWLLLWAASDFIGHWTTPPAVSPRVVAVLSSQHNLWHILRTCKDTLYSWKNGSWRIEKKVDLQSKKEGTCKLILQNEWFGVWGNYPWKLLNPAYVRFSPIMWKKLFSEG